MSPPQSPEPQLAEHTHVVDIGPLSRKSYRRKYRKIMVNFEDKMKESTTLFKEEQRIFDISQRLAEQIEQIMQIILDLNSCPQVPSRFRYDLQPPGTSTRKPQQSKTNFEEEEAHLALRKGRNDVQLGNSSLTEYRELRDQVLEASDFAPTLSHIKLAAAAALPRISKDENPDSSVGQITGVLSAKQEEQYIQAAESSPSDNSTSHMLSATNGARNRNAERNAEREREMQLRNPVSVYNWLRKHQPQVFLQDHETSVEKPSKPTGSRSSRRMTTSKDIGVKQERDYYDDDGIALESGTNSRGKRKRDDDGGYRPRGGNSRPSKRKKEESSSTVKRGKRLSVDVKS